MRAQGSLGDAARGYIYQDVATAYLLAVALFQDSDKVVVDSKEYTGDIFDDLTIIRDNFKIRRQFKSSAEATKNFDNKILRTATSGLRIDDVLDCWIKAGNSPADEYRICSTWQKPMDADVDSVLAPVDCGVTFDGWDTYCFELDLDKLWPEGGSFAWELGKRKEGIKNFSRHELVRFSERLIIELNCPQISLSWESPGDLERLLIEFLRDRIGVGRYPNDARDVTDVAARLVLRASQARARQETIAPPSLLYDLGLRSDYGRLPQKFPVTETEFVRRPEIAELKDAIISGKRRIALSGPPGSGKSWLLTKSHEPLTEAGMTVLRHYCYIDPHDKFRAERVTRKALYGNLTAALLEQLPSIKENADTKFGASRRDFERLLQTAAVENPDRILVIIVDGLDHIGRVVSSEPKLSPEQTAIVQELATLPLPSNGCLVVGSQPIVALNELSVETTIKMGKWTRRNGLELLNRMGFLSRFFRSTNLASAGFFRQLLEKSEGNPLYLRYLTVQLKDHAVSEKLSQILEDVPAIHGDLNEYYSYLFGGKQPSLFGRLLSIVDFSLSESDLREIFPFLNPEIAEWVQQLKPVLSAVTAQGGYRIYHDSFRQYVIDQCRTLNGSDNDALAPLIDWLKKRGFYKDVRAYNHLLRLLDVAERPREAIELITTAFVADSLKWFQPEDSIRANLAIAAEIAARQRDWSCLVRLSELHRVIHSAFEEHLQNIEVYSETFASIHGYEALCERLLYEGRPSFSAAIGLSLCSQCDDAGVIPPWNEYLEASTNRDKENNSLAMLHGFCRIENPSHVMNSVFRFLRDGNPSQPYLRALLRRVSKEYGRKALNWLAARLPASNQLLTFEVCLCIARSYPSKSSQRKFYSNAALYFSENPEQSREAIGAGATKLRWAKVTKLEEWVNRINTANDRVERDFVAGWFDTVRIFARRSPKRLLRTRKLIRADGWYRAWLRYLIDLCLATELAKTDPARAESSVLQAFDTLSQFDDPLSGPVRSFDLYPIRLEIQASITASLNLLHTDSSFDQFFDRVQKTMTKLTGWAFSVPWGPFAIYDIVDCFVKTARRRKLSRNALDKAGAIIAESERQGYFYQVQSDANLKFAIANALSGETEKALELWNSASERLCGYGERKDRTIFEIIAGLPKCEAATGIELIERLRPLVDKVDHFTDGKGTRHAMIYLFERICEINRSAGAFLLMDTIVAQGYNWRLKKCLHHLLLEAAGEVQPVLGYYLLESVEHADGLDDVRKSLVLLERLAAIDETLVPSAFTGLIAWPSSLHFGEEEKMFRELIEFAMKHGIEVPDRLRKTDPLLKGDYLQKPGAQVPVFAADSTVIDMIRTLRECSAREYDKRPDETKLANAIFFKALELISDGNVDQATRIITFFRDRYYLSDKGAVIEGLANGFLRYGYEELAASLFVDAYMYSRGGGGWLSLGDEGHFHLIDKAVLLAGETALHEFFDRIRNILSGPGYITGLTQYLIILCQKLDGDQKALACWDEAFNVIQSRLPTSASIPNLFEGPIEVNSDWSADELFIGLLLSIDGVDSDALRFIFNFLQTESIRPLKRLYSCLSNSSKLKLLSALEHSTPFAREAADSIRAELERTANSGWPLASPSQSVLSLLNAPVV